MIQGKNSILFLPLIYYIQCLFLMNSYIFEEVMYFWWCHIFLMMSYIFDEVIYFWWCHIFLMKSYIFDDVISFWWCHIFLMMSYIFDEVIIFYDVIYFWWCHIFLMMSYIFTWPFIWNVCNFFPFYSDNLKQYQRLPLSNTINLALFTVVKAQERSIISIKSCFSVHWLRLQCCHTVIPREIHAVTVNCDSKLSNNPSLLLFVKFGRHSTIAWSQKSRLWYVHNCYFKLNKGYFNEHICNNKQQQLFNAQIIPLANTIIHDLTVTVPTHRTWHFPFSYREVHTNKVEIKHYVSHPLS